MEGGGRDSLPARNAIFHPKRFYENMMIFSVSANTSEMTPFFFFIDDRQRRGKLCAASAAVVSDISIESAAVYAFSL